MVLNWHQCDYFSALMHRDKRAYTALEWLVDDLHTDKDRTIQKFLTHSGSEDFLWGLVKLLGNENSRVAGNAAYILGTLAESETGCFRVLNLTTHQNSEARRILSDLTNMLRFEDAESVMNAAGTMGTLAESAEGRQWMLSEPCLEKTIQYITDLLSSDNLWTASNAALVLARLTISEEGCEHILNHPQSSHVLARLITSLGVDEAGRGMNAAFAIGRLCDLEAGRSRLLGLPESERMVSLLARMLCCTDPGASKNACFALSCLATSREGHTRLLKNSYSEDVLRTLSELLSSEDGETGWFAAMTLRTLASQPRGCLRIRDHTSVLPALKSVRASGDENEDLQDEVQQTLDILKRLDKPPPCRVSVLGATELLVCWEAATTKSGFPIRYQLFEGSRCVYNGPELEQRLRGLTPHTSFTFRLRACTEGDDSPLSDVVTEMTEEDVPSEPTDVKVLACTTTQLKLGWGPPLHPNGNLRGYYVYNGEKLVEHTHEITSIITSLQPSSTHTLAVCVATSKGKGPKVEVTGSTIELGAHAPAKPEVTVRGRFELNIAWRPPEVPLGKITRYDVRLNGEVVYSGMDLHYEARRLRPDTDYSVTVSAITNEGKCESKATKKRTAKDDYDGDRAPLYPPPQRKDEPATSERREEPKSSAPAKKPAARRDAAKSRSASAASIKKYVKLSLHSQSRERFPKSKPPPARFAESGSVRRAAVATLMYTHRTPTATAPLSPTVAQLTAPAPPILTPANKPEKKEDIDVTRPLSKHVRKEDQMKQKEEASHRLFLPATCTGWEYSLRSHQSLEIPQRSHTSASQHSGAPTRPQSHAVSAAAEVEVSQPGTLQQRDARLPSASDTTHSVEENIEESLNSTNISDEPPLSTKENLLLPSQLHDKRTSSPKVQRVISPKMSGDRKVLPKPKPPNVRKSRRTPQQSQLQSRSSESVENLAAGGAAGESGSDASSGKHGATSRPRVSSRKPMLSKRQSITNSLEEMEAKPDTGSSASTAASERSLNSRVSYEYTRADPAYESGVMHSSSRGAFWPADALQRSRTGVVEFEAPLPPPSGTSGLTPTYVQRANTFIERHRIGRKSFPSGLRGAGVAPSSGSGSHAVTMLAEPQHGGGGGSNPQQQWSPDFPPEPLRRSNSKFVPMQFRTQPANLPGAMRRQASNVNMGDKGLQSDQIATRTAKADLIGPPPIQSQHTIQPTKADLTGPPPSQSQHATLQVAATTVSTGFMELPRQAREAPTPRGQRVASTSGVRAVPGASAKQQPAAAAAAAAPGRVRAQHAASIIAPGGGVGAGPGKLHHASPRTSGTASGGGSRVAQQTVMSLAMCTQPPSNQTPLQSAR